MLAPCGVEIKVGQVWAKDGSNPPVSIEILSENLYPLVDYVAVASVSWTPSYAHPYPVHRNEFTSNRGGYKLVKEEPDEMRGMK